MAVRLAFDDVYLLPVRDRRLVFSPRRGLSALVNAAAVDSLRAGEPVAGLSELVAELAQPALPVPVREGPAHPPFLGLVVTRGCNMACVYCDFAANQSEPPMPPEVALGAIDGWTEHLRRLGESRLELHFFGGEPFVQGDLVQIAVHRTRALAAQHGLTTHFEASTNGLLSERDLSFVKHHFDAVVLSLDGPADVHDRHRPLPGGRSGFERVCRTARELSDSPIELCLRCCVSDANVAALPDIAAWLIGEFRPQVLNLEPLTPTDSAAAAGIGPPDPFDYARAFLAAWRVSRAAGVECVYAAAYGQPRRSVCPVGQDVFIVSPSGGLRSCYLRREQWEAEGLELRLGQVTEDGLTIDQAAVERLRHLMDAWPRCSGCACRWSCAGGCVVREAADHRAERRSNFCRQTRVLQTCLLLEDLGQGALADALLADAAALAVLANQPDDRLAGDAG